MTILRTICVRQRQSHINCRVSDVSVRPHKLARRGDSWCWFTYQVNPRNHFACVCNAWVTEPRLTREWKLYLYALLGHCVYSEHLVCVYNSSHKPPNRFQWNLMCEIQVPTLRVFKNISFHSPFSHRNPNFTYSSNMPSFVPVPQPVTILSPRKSKGWLQCAKVLSINYKSNPVHTLFSFGSFSKQWWKATVSIVMFICRPGISTIVF
jgi:hypothetical protein